MNIAEQQVNFLIKVSAALSHIQSDETRQLLRSHYLLRCSQLTGGVRLPLKHFSYEIRCSRCLLEWTKETERTVRAIKLSKSQRRRIRSKAKHKKSVNKEYLLHSKNLETVCSFCKHTTKTPILKPSRNHKKILEEKSCDETPKIKTKKKNVKTEKIQKNDKFQSSVYYDSKAAFSLTKQNTLPSLMKDSPKIIKNNKRKKDKFAGLCQAAVIASAKLKEEKEKQSTNNEKQKPNKLSLFLKPSN